MADSETQTGDLRRVLRNSSRLIIARIVTKVATTGLTILIARTQGDENFGVYSTLFSFIALFSILEEFGLTVPMIRRLAKRESSPGVVLGRVLALKMPLGAVAYVLLILASYLFHLSLELAFIFGASMFFEMLAVSVTRSFEGFERMEYVAFLTIVERSVLCSLGIAILLLGGGLSLLGGAYVFTNLLVLIIGTRLFRRQYGRIELHIDKQEGRRLLREAAPFFVSGFFAVLYNRTDIYFLSMYRSLAEVGWYNAAYRIIDAQMFIPVSIVSSVFPVLARYYGKQPHMFYRLHSRSFYLLLILGLSITVATYVAASFIILTLYAEKYAQAIVILQILSLMLCFYFVNFLLGNALIAAGREKLSTATLILGTGLNVSLNVLFIPRYGVQGAAWAKVGTEFFAFVFQFYMLQRVSGTREMYFLPRLRDAGAGS
jgi:O-antigen/teichoic acid export membrane protein